VNFQAAVIAAEIDGVTAAARGFSANRAVAEIERAGMGGFQREPYRLAVA
jgi:hypothetical protein